MREGVLDTDTLSYLINGNSPAVTNYARQYLRVFRRYTVVCITVSEIIEGLVRISDQARLDVFLELAQDLNVLPIETDEAILAGRILGALARSGQRIGDLDPFIAAVAISHELPLVTNNVRHYRRIVGLGFPLELENWRESESPS